MDFRPYLIFTEAPFCSKIKFSAFTSTWCIKPDSFHCYISMNSLKTSPLPVPSNQHGYFSPFGQLHLRSVLLSAYTAYSSMVPCWIRTDSGHVHPTRKCLTAHCSSFNPKTIWPNASPVQATQVYIQFSASAPFYSLLPLCVLRQLFYSQSWPGTVVTKVLSSAGSD